MSVRLVCGVVLRVCARVCVLWCVSADIRAVAGVWGGRGGAGYKQDGQRVQAALLFPPINIDSTEGRQCIAARGRGGGEGAGVEEKKHNLNQFHN